MSDIQKEIEYQNQKIKEWIDAGHILFQEKKYHESIDYFNKVLRIDPLNKEVQNLKKWLKKSLMKNKKDKKLIHLLHPKKQGIYY